MLIYYKYIFMQLKDSSLHEIIDSAAIKYKVIKYYANEFSRHLEMLKEYQKYSNHLILGEE